MEYGGHCRDLVEVLGERVEAMLDGAIEAEPPAYDDFDGEASVIESEYWRIDPAELARRYEETTERTRDTLRCVEPGDWERTGRRGDGYVFTTTTLCQYIVHDAEHHLVDVGD